MPQRVIILLLGLFLVSWTHGTHTPTAFTSNCAGSTCNWNNGASWTGGSGSNWPQFSGDTATISANDQVTIPSGVTVNVGAITYAAGTSGTTTVTINGNLSLFGNLTLAAASILAGGAGGVLDLRGNNVESPTSGTIQYNFTGNSGSHFTIKSTGSPGKFVYNSSSTVLSTWSYVDVTGLGDSVFGRGQTTAGTLQSYSYVTFTNCNLVALEDGTNGANSGILISHVDFRDPMAANPVSSGAYQPLVDFGSVALGSQQRTIEYTTWSRSSPTTTNTGIMFLRATGLTINNSVFGDYKTYILNVSSLFENTYQSMHNDNDPAFSMNGSNPDTMTSVYLYNGGGQGHGFSFGNTESPTITNSVFENVGGSSPTNFKWFLGFDGTNGTYTIHNNVVLGASSVLDFAINSAGSLTPTILYYNNTHFMDNIANCEGTPTADGMRVDHPNATLTGSDVEFYNNIIDKPNTSTAQDAFISLTTSTADQVTYADYNAGFEEPATSPSPPVLYTTGNCPATPSITVTGGYATHDFAAAPQFVANTRNVAAWDTSLGGPGTEAHALAQMLLLNSPSFNSNYIEANLLAYVRAGFVVQNHSAYSGTGRSGGDVGALPVP